MDLVLKGTGLYDSLGIKYNKLDTININPLSKKQVVKKIQTKCQVTSKKTNQTLLCVLRQRESAPFFDTIFKLYRTYPTIMPNYGLKFMAKQFKKNYKSTVGSIAINSY